MTPIRTAHQGARSRYDTSVFEEHVLASGVTVWIQRSPVQLSEEGIFVAYFPKIGSVLDPEGKEGVAHFFEHMPFKGTERFPTRALITASLRDVGGGSNAGTGNGIIRYHTSAIRESSQLALDVLADVVRRPLMRPEDFEVERGVIQAERARKFEHGATLARHDVDALLYGTHPAFRWGIGSEASINAITLEDVLAYQRSYQHADNLHVVVGGSFSEDPDILTKVDAAFAGMPRGEKSQPVIPSLPALEPVRRRIANPRYGRGRFYAEWTLPEEVSHESIMALGLLATAYAGGEDSPLALEVRDRRGLVYESGLLKRSWVWDVGARVTLELPVPPEQFDEILATSIRLLREMPDERVALQLERWQLDRLTSFQGPISSCHGLAGDFVLFGRPRAIHEIEALLDAIDLDLVHWWRDYLTSTPPAIVETSPDGQSA